jgi:hypothetical protein
VREKRESREVARDTTFKGEGQEIFPSGLRESQAVPVRPSGVGIFERA